MTRMTNARVAGSAFLLYIVLGLPAGMLMTRATSAQGIAAKLKKVIFDPDLRYIENLLPNCKKRTLITVRRRAKCNPVRVDTLRRR